MHATDLAASGERRTVNGEREGKTREKQEEKVLMSTSDAVACPVSVHN